MVTILQQQMKCFAIVLAMQTRKIQRTDKLILSLMQFLQFGSPVCHELLNPFDPLWFAYLEEGESKLV